MIIIIILFIIILVIFFYYQLKKHYWFNFSLLIHKNKINKYFSIKDPSILSTSNIDEINIENFVELYKQYYPSSFLITKKTFINFFKYNANPFIIYKIQNNFPIAAILVSLQKYILHQKNISILNIDYAIVDLKFRNKNIFQALMHEIADIGNKNNVFTGVFKTDLKPIPFLKYNFLSMYYKTAFKKLNEKFYNKPVKIREISEIDINKLYAKLQRDFVYYPGRECLESILTKNKEFINFCIDAKIIFSFKYNSPKIIEIINIFFLEEKINMQLLEEGIIYILGGYNFEEMVVEDVGMNGIFIKWMGNLMQPLHKSYHYFLGVTEKIEKEKCIL